MPAPIHLHLLCYGTKAARTDGTQIKVIHLDCVNEWLEPHTLMKSCWVSTDPCSDLSLVYQLWISPMKNTTNLLSSSLTQLRNR